MSSDTVTSTGGELRTLALNQIHTDSEFNPRTSTERSQLAELEESIRRHGVLQPVLVTSDGEGRYRLIAGHRRVAAATAAGLTEIPAIVRPVADDTRGLDLALVENMARQDLNPVEEAVAFQRLVDGGLTRKGVAQALGVSQKLVTERLALLELPASMHSQIADGTIPPGAIRALVALAKIHADLPAVAVARVLAGPAHDWDEPLTWTQVAEDPILAVCSDYEGDEGSLPPDVYEAGASYPVERFTLDDKAAAKLEELCELIGCTRDRFTVRFGHEAVETAEQLSALHRAASGGPWSALISRQEVADQLAVDYIEACLNLQRESKRRAEQLTHQRGQFPDDATGSSHELTEEELKEQRRHEREAQQEARQQAEARNAELGAAIVKHLSRVKVDDRVLKILTAIDVHGDLQRIAARGARYGFPGWTKTVELKTGKTKTEYSGPPEAAARARDYLAGAKTAAEIAGRCVALLVMARYANEDAVANSQRSFYQLYVGDHGLPWKTEVIDFLDEIAAERLPEHVMKHARGDKRRVRESVK
jgi:ParB/RepB/Spo0J family partition protein